MEKIKEGNFQTKKNGSTASDHIQPYYHAECEGFFVR